MLSKNIRRQGQLLLNTRPPSNSISVGRLCLLRLRRSQLYSRSISSEVATPADPAPVPPPAPPAKPSEDNPANEAPSEPLDVGFVQVKESAKVKVRHTRNVPPSKPAPPECVDLPEDLNIFWLPDALQASSSLEAAAASPDLPPPDVLEETLNNLLITLHPQIQHRTSHPPNGELPVEPTLGLYCPIEGGDYIIDATVKELARRIGAEVLVLDSVQLAAGEWGSFGKAANSLQLPVNPLKFPYVPQPSHSSTMDEYDAGEDEVGPTQHMMTLLLQPQLAQVGGRSLISSAARRSPTRGKLRVFFDTLINQASPTSEGITSSTKTTARPRIIYIRDFTTLAPTSSVWYTDLLAAVRSRRRGPISNPSSPVTDPITIVFGMTPPLFSSTPTGFSGGQVFNFLMNNQSPGGLVQEQRPEKVDWSESEYAERARERRLQERLKKWEKHEALLMSELPRLAAGVEEEGPDGAKPEVIVIGANGGRAPLPPGFGGSAGLAPGRPGRNSDSDLNRSSFFRTSVLVPAKRSHSRERGARMARRREINELGMRMGVGAIGGNVEPAPAGKYFEETTPESTNAPDAVAAETEAAMSETAVAPAPKAPSVDVASAPKPSEEEAEPQSMWEDWGNRIEAWPNVKRIADSAVGRVLASSYGIAPSLDHTIVPWTSVQSAWKVYKTAKANRKTWMKDYGPAQHLTDVEASSGAKEATAVDEIVERVKNAADLDTHEQRLLGCIVDSAAMPTSFNQVHLPPHVIDSVRTIVSLPLLHPNAFQQGILKQHGMTGCLLFGPPGTGKTLVVRALAKEAGCRMMSITPSDIMDLYVGEAEKLVRSTFSLARRLSPCVIFLDEIDALFGARMAARESGGAAAAHRGVITEFMQEMDGLKSSRDDGVIVIGATNRPFDLDDAILRRMPRRLLIDLPGEREREEILKILLRDEVLGSDVTHKMLAQKTESYSGSDLKHLCVSAALDSVKEVVSVPWQTSSNIGAPAAVPSPPSEVAEAAPTPAPKMEDSTPSGIAAEPSEVKNVAAASSDSAPMAVESPEPLSTPTDAAATAPHVRTLHLRNFLKALKEITPSSSEALGSLSDLRKWNDEFGEGRRDRKRTQVWGKGRFGFIDERAVKKVEEGRVTAAPPTSPTPTPASTPATP